MNKHTLISLIFFAIISLNVNAQRYGVPNLREYDYDSFHFGLLLGINQMDFRIKQDFASLNYYNNPAGKSYLSSETGGIIDPTKNAYLYSVLPSSNTGFTIGIVSSLRLSNNFNLRFIPSISFGSRSLKYSFVQTDNSNVPITVEKSIPSTFLEFPFILRYKGERIQNARPFVEAGFKYAYDLELKTNNTNTITPNTSTNLAIPDVHLNKSDIYGVLGVGFDFYFDWFKMGVEGTMNYGLINDVLKRSATPPMYESGITSLKSKIFQISVTFE
ncbi:MAG TPA: porin family protein [Candidatus Paceibacterota bacterium]